MTHLPYQHVGSCIPCTTPEQKILLQRAKKLVSDRGKEVLSEELSRPISDIPSELFPYIFLALQEFKEHPLTLETIAVPDHLRGVNSISEVTSKLKLPSLRSNCTAVDDILGSGLPVGSGSIFELSGKAGAGKTQIGIQFALMSPAPLVRGGLETPSIYIFTEGRPPIRRMEEIDLAMTTKFGLPPRSLLERVVTEKILSSDDLLRLAEHRLSHLLRRTGARLVVIDSIAAVYRPEFSDPLSRADHLVRMASALRRAMTAVKGVCFCINQVSQALDSYNSLNATVPALGPAWSNCVSTRLFLSRARERRFIRVTHSSYLPTTEGSGNAFLVTGEGAVDEDSNNE